MKDSFNMVKRREKKIVEEAYIKGLQSRISQAIGTGNLKYAKKLIRQSRIRATMFYFLFSELSAIKAEGRLR